VSSGTEKRTTFRRRKVQGSGAAAGADAGPRPLIDEWLIADREAPRKQRHTAKRIW